MNNSYCLNYGRIYNISKTKEEILFKTASGDVTTNITKFVELFNSVPLKPEHNPVFNSKGFCENPTQFFGKFPYSII